jgi:hypothetical protein
MFVAVRFLDRPTEFTCVNSRAEGRKLILEQEDAAVVFLDVGVCQRSCRVTSNKFS